MNDPEFHAESKKMVAYFQAWLDLDSQTISQRSEVLKRRKAGAFGSPQKTGNPG